MVNGHIKPMHDGDDFSVTLSMLYHELTLSYPKFHKMDTLSKTAFLGTELLLSENERLKSLADDEIGLFFSNKESSLNADLNFQHSYQEDKNPSPSHFVYTLPNILIGEIAIKNKWYGENLFLIFPKFDAQEIVEQIEVLFQKGVKACICGWVNITQEKVDSFLFVVEKETVDGQPLTAENLFKLYQ